MTSQEPNTAVQGDNGETDSGATTFDPFAEILALARQGVSRSRLFAGSLRAIARHFNSPYASVHVCFASEVFQDDCHFGNSDPQFWKASLQDFLTDALTDPQPKARTLRAKQGGARVAFLSAPIVVPSGLASGALGLVIAPIRDDQVTSCLAKLEALTRLASCAVEFLGMANHGSGSGVSLAAVQARSRASSCETPAELAYAITNELRNKLGCEQVILAMIHRRRARIISISGLDEVRKQSPGVVSMVGALEECVDTGAAIAYQQSGAWSGDGVQKSFRMHKQWHTCAKGDAVASLPLRSGDEIAAVLGIRKSSDRQITLEDIEEIRKRVEPFAAALRLSERANRNVFAHVRDSAYAVLDHVIEPGRWGRKVAAALMLMAGLWFSFGTMNYELGVDAVVVAAELRHVSNPFEGVLLAAPHVEGDRVKAGDILCRFDQRALQQERDQLTAERRVIETNMDIARAGDSPYEVQLARARKELVETKLAIVDRRIDQAAVRAPIDGVIVAGDLRKKIGGVFLRGDPLFQIAPLDKWMLELHVPDAASADLQTELAGVFASFARPDVTQSFAISRVMESARPRNERNVFLAEATLGGTDPWLRPGMEGVAKVRVGVRRIWWIALHKAVDYLRINFWL
ncbi:MAG: efflux RND transporter periplasmic adaptor subunit [Planctomycetota bacterium]|jgi:hypothetical protein